MRAPNAAVFAALVGLAAPTVQGSESYGGGRLTVSTYNSLINAVASNNTVIGLADNIVLGGTVPISSVLSLLIDGQNSFEVNGQANYRCFSTYNSEVVIQNLTITNCYVSGKGAGVYVGGSSAVRMSGVTITSCSVTSTGSGGAIYVDSSSLVMVDSVMSSNYAYYGGGLGVGASSGVSLMRVTIFNNGAVYGGGVEASSSSAALNMTDCTLASNYAIYHGGALQLGSGAIGILTDCVFDSNHAKLYGGAINIYTASTSLTFYDYEFVGNYDLGSSHEDIYRQNSATLTFVNTCPAGSHNFGSGWLECPSCAISHLPAVFDRDDCKSSTGTFTNITTQSDLVDGLMIDRTLVLGADVDLTDTVYMLLGVSEAPITGLVIDGIGLYAVDGGDAVRCFFVYGSGTDIVFRNLTISNGFVSSSSQDSSHGAAVYVGGSSAIRMSGVTITSCSVASTGSGGAIYVESSSLVMVDIVMSSNYAYYGGGLGVGASSGVSLMRVTMSSNSGVEGGGFYSSSTHVTLNMTGCSLSSNSVSGSGGGVEIQAAISFNLTRCTFSSNYARYDGGALRVGFGAVGTLTECVFDSNHADRYGGAVTIYRVESSLTIYDYKFFGNYDSTSSSHEDIYRAHSAALNFVYSCPAGSYNFGSGLLECPNCAISHLPAVLHYDGCKSSTGVFTNITTQNELAEAIMINRTLVLGADIDLTDTIYMLLGISEAALTGLVIDGGGLYSVEGGDAVRCFFIHTLNEEYFVRVSFLDLTIIDGYAASTSLGGSYGGAVYAGSSVQLIFSGCMISSSTASYGSGIYVASDSTLHMDYCTFYYNRGATSGGGLYFSGTSATLAHIDFSENYAVSGGGAYLAAGTTSMVMYTFVSNTGTTGADLYVSSSSNFVPDDGCSRGTLNYGTGVLFCSGCSSGYLPANLDTQPLIPTPSPTFIPSPVPTPLPSLLPTPIPTLFPSPIPTPSPTSLPSSSPSSIPSPVPTPLPSISSLPSALPTPSPTPLPSAAPSPEPSIPPTPVPTISPPPTPNPSPLPTAGPTPLPTISSLPSIVPTLTPTGVPTQTHQPTPVPSAPPSPEPTLRPSGVPTSSPYPRPSPHPSGRPTGRPTKRPTLNPTPQPTVSMLPSSMPTGDPTSVPSQTLHPTSKPSVRPSLGPTLKPSLVPSLSPRLSPQPTSHPSEHPTLISSLQPASRRRRLAQTLTPSPSLTPTFESFTSPSTTLDTISFPPSLLPSSPPTSLPSSAPTALPSQYPTLAPTFFFPPTVEPTSSYMQACAVSTPQADVNTEELLEGSVMHNRTVFLGADIYLSKTFYILIGLNEVLDFVLDGKGVWKLDGRDAVRCLFIVGSGLDIRLQDLTVTNGYASSSSLNGYYGGGIYVGDGAILTMEGCTVSSSRAANYGRGAGICIDNAVVSLVNTVIEFNWIYYGKGAGIYLASSSVLGMSGGSIKYNFARSSSCYTVSTMEGGGLYVAGGALATISDASIEDNIAFQGGGVYVAPLGELVLNNASLTGNSYMKDYSGTTYNAMYRSGCSTSYAYQSYGGGIFSESNTKVILSGSKIFSNIAYYYGGGVYFSSGTSASISDSPIKFNYATYRGGGIYSSDTTITMNNSAVESNSLAGTSSRYFFFSSYDG